MKSMEWPNLNQDTKNPEQERLEKRAKEMAIRRATEDLLNEAGLAGQLAKKNIIVYDTNAFKKGAF